MNICPKCNTQTEGTYCPLCGTKTVFQNSNVTYPQNQQHSIDNFVNNIQETAQKSTEEITKKFNSIDNSNFVAAIGMIPTFFWVPLVANIKNKKYTRCASNGLFLGLLNFFLSIIYSWIIDFFTLDIFNILVFSDIIKFINSGYSIITILLEIISIVFFILVLLGKEIYYPIIGKKDIFYKE